MTPPGRARRPLARALALNLGGVVAAAAFAVAAVPYVTRALGPERFGVLALVWTTVGYLGLFHFGVGRALTQAGAGPAGTEREHEMARLLWAGLLFTGALGALVGVLLALGAPLLATHLLRVSPGLRGEAVTSFHILGAALPFVITVPVLVGALEARMRFGWTNGVSTATAAVGYLGPVAVVLGGGGLVGVVAVVAGSRVLAWIAYLGLCLVQHPAMRRASRPAGEDVMRLLRFGGWTTVTNVVSPVMVYLDRYVVAAAVSATAVAYYAAPQEVMLRTGLLTGAVSGALFPAFAAAYHQGSAGQLRALVARGVDAALLVILPLAVAMAAFAHEGLQRWLGGDYAAQGAPVVTWLAAGVVVNGLAKVAAMFNQAIGRPDVVARLHLAELPVYLVVLWLLVGRFGLTGAAAAWVIRAAGDAVAQFVAARRLVPGIAPAAGRALAGGLLGSAAVAAAALSGPLTLRIAVLAAVLALAAARALAPAARPATA